VDGIGRPYLAPPGTPAPVMKILRDAFAKALKDPELRKDAKRSQMDVQFVPPEECLRLVNYILNQPDDVVGKVSKYIKF
jgi:tripartite-type tricarboxylate transporter receptor subunit TctC